MNKEQAIQSFWESFGLPAYDEQTVPSDVTLPYITYSVATASLNEVVAMTASIWYKSTSWKNITDKKDEIARAIGPGGKVVKLDSGYMWINRNAPFAQRVSDETDDTIRRYYLQLLVEFLTED